MSEVHLLNLSGDNHYPYKVVHSKRAKYVRIKLSNCGELSVVLPKGTSSRFAHDFIKHKMLWVEKNLQKMPTHKSRIAPELLDLKLLGECWKVDYENIDRESASLVEQTEQKLMITANAKNLEDIDLLQNLINRWCKKKARYQFEQMLEQLAEQHGFHYQRLSIRSQKTRWGSCSSKKNINLNAKLLFLPKEIVEYVMIHELCHTIEMNHSQRFWSLVEDCDPDYKNNRKRLKQLGKEIVL
jgi:hypothetical protein